MQIGRIFHNTVCLAISGFGFFGDLARVDARQPDLEQSPYHRPAQMEPSQSAPRQAQPRQVPPKSINGVPVNTQIYGQVAQNGQDAQPSLPGHPSLTVLPTQHYRGGQPNPQAVRVAMNEMPPAGPPAAAATPNPQYAHAVQDPRLANPASPVNPVGTHTDTRPAVQSLEALAPRVNVQMPPFPPLAPEQAAELDAVLDRWERSSANVERLEMDFKLYYWDGGATIGLFDPNVPTYVADGTFNFVAPNRVLYEVQSAKYTITWTGTDGKPQSVERASQPEKWLYDGKAILDYRAAEKKVLEYPIPPEQQGKGLAESPLPLVFGAKKEDMKSRYWMRLVTEPEWKDKQVWIELFPRWQVDSTEFSRIEMRLDAKTLAPVAMRKVESNGKTKIDYGFVVKKPAVLDLTRWIGQKFTTDVPRGWTKEIVRYDLPQRAETPGTATTQPLIQQNTGVPPQAPASNDPSGTTLYDPEANRTNTLWR